MVQEAQHLLMSKHPTPTRPIATMVLALRAGDIEPGDYIKFAQYDKARVEQVTGKASTVAKSTIELKIVVDNFDRRTVEVPPELWIAIV